MDICSSPQLFAAYHVLLRLLVPRHPPCALCNLTLVEMGRLHGTSPAAQARLQTTVCAVEEAFLRNAYHERKCLAFLRVTHLNCILDNSFGSL